jgi:hypothetical protein
MAMFTPAQNPRGFARMIFIYETEFIVVVAGMPEPAK